ncbi:MAG: DUF1315 family protein [Porticoccaceae bacterium]|nr:DUF1315 family protein [Pseudomonadales bacterium]MCP5171877.1 DUF1315 family protein [Pseudomonadales bacterium]
MDLQQLISSITPEAYSKLRQAVEIGKWSDGTPLTSEQKENCLQAVIAYDAAFKQEEDRVGFIHTKKHSHCGGEGKVEPSDDQPKPLKWN